ncbi:MAG: XRE family transcriptional regulator [Chryseobacterium sp.]|nr:MAG: XRE family transcriptional regulator [Chryseobacterium sp.]
MTEQDRLKRIINEIKFRYSRTQGDIAEDLGVKKTYLSDMLNGRVPVTDNIKTKLSELYSYSDVEEAENQVSEPLSVIYRQDLFKGGLKKPVPYYNMDFSGGWNSDEIFTSYNPDFYINHPEFDGSEFACNLIGHSISRRIPSRAIIGLKEVNDWQTYFTTNQAYGVIMRNELRTVKIVKRSRQSKSHLLLIPDPLPEHNHTGYEPEEVPIDFISKFFLVVAWAQVERIAQ